MNAKKISVKKKCAMKITTKKMIMTALMAGIAFVLNTFVYFPAMAPFQHCVNVIAVAFLGPWYGCLAAFLCGVLRMMSGRTIQAIVGAIFGPIIGGLLYKRTNNIYLLAVGEIFGTGVLSAVAVYPLMRLFYKLEAVNWYYYIPFYTPSAIVGALMGVAVLIALKKSKLFERMKTNLDER